MRTEPAILIIPLALGAILYFGFRLAGAIPGVAVVGPAPIAAAIVLILFLGILMASNSESVREIVKQIAVWLGIVVLLPPVRPVTSAE